MKPLFVILPGYVTSRHDGQRHYIQACELIRLYQVYGEDVVVHESSHGPHFQLSKERVPMVYLPPQYDGEYEYHLFDALVRAWLLYSGVD